MALRLLANPSRHGWGLHPWFSAPSISSFSASRRLTALQRQFASTTLQPVFSIKEAISSSSIVPHHNGVGGLSSWELNKNLGRIRPPRGRLNNGRVRCMFLDVTSKVEDRIIASTAVRHRGGYGLGLVLQAAEKEEWFCFGSRWRLRVAKPEGRSWWLVAAKSEVGPRQQSRTHRSAGVTGVAAAAETKMAIGEWLLKSRVPRSFGRFKPRLRPKEFWMSKVFADVAWIWALLWTKILGSSSLGFRIWDPGDFIQQTTSMVDFFRQQIMMLSLYILIMEVSGAPQLSALAKEVFT